MLMQRLWLMKLQWDQNIEDRDIREGWTSFITDLDSLNHCKIPRYLGCSSELNIVGYCDASELAYGICIYGVTKNESRLLIAKSRVAPLKRVTLARLELCGAVLLVNVLSKLVGKLNVKMSDCELFTDSQTVLAWLSKASFEWKTFVGNRVEYIHSRTRRSQWHHICSKRNPADIISRGTSPKALRDNTLWWNGHRDFQSLLAKSDNFTTNIDQRRLKVKILIVNLDYSFERFSGFMKLVRTFIRVLYVSRKMLRRIEIGEILRFGAREFDEALTRIIWNVQRSVMEDSINRLKDGRSLRKSDHLLSLNPFLDDNDLLRIGGRLQYAQMPFNEKHPIILPKTSHVTRLIIAHEHISNNHIGINSLLGIIRTKYWIVNARSALKSVLRKCVVCARFNAKRVQPMMGPLPIERTTASRPFSRVGVDYAGPFFVRPTRNRGNTTIRCYLAVFVCFSVKAVHIEIVYDLSSSSFLACLKRFVARRGKPLEIYSDNGTNFVGANSFLIELQARDRDNQFKSDIEKFGGSQGIVWHFIPPRAPNFGGLWEASIKSAKRCLYKCIRNERLSIEEFETVIVDIEATLYSRPLCFVSDAVDELNVLTPSHFLTGASLKALPNVSQVDVQQPLKKRWSHVQALNKLLWERYVSEYVASLQQRSKNFKDEGRLNAGDVVLIVGENTSPRLWPLARVEELYPGKDGRARVALLYSNRNFLKRSVTKLVRLPIDCISDGTEIVGDDVEINCSNGAG